MQVAPQLLLLAAAAAYPVLGYPIVPRALQRYGSIDGPVWGDPYEAGSELTDNRISSENDRGEAVVFETRERDREVEGILEKPLESLLDEGVVAELEALGEPRLEALLRGPARLLVARPAEVRAALGRPVYETLSVRAAHLLRQLPARVLMALRRLLRLPLRDVLRADPSLEPLLRSFINAPDRPVTCAPGQGVASDGTCRDKWKRHTR
ncbi:uncharacterized protein LOC126457506 [Schistocerca serialis cubense]|uniref:uncharacterized protein LOC126457506 n=1 Tax=Schistocerca serialis cubense TaxID=2023355 RepID=UPI00214ED8A4|nr:uncharacterized protein LOC126457506 [Schistocerca serialis cubense]